MKTLERGITKARDSHPPLLFSRLYCAALTGCCAQLEWQRGEAGLYGPEAEHEPYDDREQFRCEQIVNRAYLLARLAFERLNREEDIKEFNSKVEAK